MSNPSFRFSRRNFLQGATAAATTMLASRVFAAGATETRKVDVCVYGGTSGGVIAAVALAKIGRSVLLVEPTRHLGGMTSGGLGWVDVGRADSIGGLTRQYFTEVKQYYKSAGIETDGWRVEPHVAEAIFDRWASDHHVDVVREARLASVTKRDRRITAVHLDKAPPDGRGAPAAEATEREFLTVEAAMFIDCSYEGDLLAQAGVSHRTDREGRDEFGEDLAGFRLNPLDANGSFGYTAPGSGGMPPIRIDPYIREGDASSGLLPLISDGPLATEGGKNPVVQSYNFRLCLTKDDPIPIAAPSDYDPRRYELVRRYVAALDAASHPLWEGDLYWAFGHKLRYPHPRLLKITKLLNGKTDVNNAGSVSMDYVTGGAERYANATWAERAKIWHAHEDYQRGFLYYLRTEERLPDWLRREVGAWGLCKDEFRDSGGWPTQMYVREARRMVGGVVISQRDCDAPSRRDDSIGLGSYSLDSHLCQRFVKDGQVINEGGFFHHVPKAYPLPYPVIVPRAEDCENLLVTFCVSSTHAAFASFRMEPPFMILSESAALAADQAMRQGTGVQAIDVAKLRDRIRDDGQKV